jgi:hypothetical protein
MPVERRDGQENPQQQQPCQQDLQQAVMVKIGLITLHTVRIIGTSENKEIKGTEGLMCH